MRSAMCPSSTGTVRPDAWSERLLLIALPHGEMRGAVGAEIDPENGV